MLPFRKSHPRQATAALLLLMLASLIPMLALGRPMETEPLIGSDPALLEALFRALDQEEAESSSFAGFERPQVDTAVPTVAQDTAPPVAHPWPLSALRKEDSFDSVPAYTHPSLFTAARHVFLLDDLEKASPEERELVLQKLVDDLRQRGLLIYNVDRCFWADPPYGLIPFRYWKTGSRIKRHIDFVKRMRYMTAFRPSQQPPAKDFIVNSFLIHFLADHERSNGIFKAYYVIAVPLQELLKPKNTIGHPSLALRVKEVGELMVPLEQRPRPSKRKSGTTSLVQPS
ncbi:uncharacterized protein PFL1_01470 [Pseudozyma flocculosa PF-1]|uniref:Uncharacterized protein n=1 Tax=Pseudozyma flocculosa TaxID=84751 RepID=A0A5C3FC77_9BASI|nr:uncharacterized protein PFL1_01470 [Pseudozyma flocculosa PF-1]EPQ31285.1 hypothetical protein PFL1_01470 [Pseudozyma flocculosa PF-1]SPO41746.1 uncharacterized protein PSFLO_07228 [Pseudozyma flocculosa]